MLASIRCVSFHQGQKDRDLFCKLDEVGRVNAGGQVVNRNY